MIFYIKLNIDNNILIKDCSFKCLSIYILKYLSDYWLTPIMMLDSHSPSKNKMINGSLTFLQNYDIFMLRILTIIYYRNINLVL